LHALRPARADHNNWVVEQNRQHEAERKDKEIRQLQQIVESNFKETKFE